MSTTKRAIHTSVLVAACALWALHTAQGAQVLKSQVAQEVVTLCVRHSDQISTVYSDCQQLIDLYNNEVSAWFGMVSGGVTDFVFVPPTYHTSPPADGWNVMSRQTTDGFFGINTFQEDVFDDLDPEIDFTGVDRVVVVAAGAGFFGQAIGCGSPEYPYLCSIAIRTDEATENEYVIPVEEGGGTEKRDQMAVAVVSEWDVNTYNGIQPTSGILQHELGHLLGLPDRYPVSYLSGVGGRGNIDGYDTMGTTDQTWIGVHALGQPQARLGFAGHSATHQVVSKTATESIDIVPPAYSTSNPAVRSVVYLPLSGTTFNFRDFRGYTVESRDRALGGDAVRQEGVVVTWIDPNLREDLELYVEDDPGMPGLGDAALEVGDVFSDVSRGVRVEVVSTIPWVGGYNVEVTNADPSNMKPDPRITPWGPNWESVDIWVDSPTNGYDVYTYADGNRDLPAIRASTSDPALTNRVYFRIHNDGLIDAQNTQVRVYWVESGIGQVQWNLMGTASIPAITPGDSISGFVNWVIPDALASSHVCLKVEIVDDPTDAQLGNNLAHENIAEFETVSSSPWHPRTLWLTVENPSEDFDASVRMYVRDLPPGWAAEVWPEVFELAPEALRNVRFTIHPGGSPANPSTGYEAGYVGQTPVEAFMHFGDGDDRLVGGVMVRTRLTLATKLGFEIADPTEDTVVFSGCLLQDGSPVVGGRVVVQTTTASDSKQYPVVTDTSGCYQVEVTNPSPLAWKAAAFYAAESIYGSSRSASIHFGEFSAVPALSGTGLWLLAAATLAIGVGTVARPERASRRRYAR